MRVKDWQKTFLWERVWKEGYQTVRPLNPACVCVCVCVCVRVHVYVVYEDTNLYNDMGMT